MTNTSTPAMHCDDVAELYRRHYRDLQSAVASAVSAPRELIEDACQTAWTIMLRSQPCPAAAFSWLRVVAIREAYRLCRATRDEHLEDLGAPHGWEPAIAGAVTLDDAVEARRALRRLAELPQRQRQDLILRVAGYSYREIRQLTPGRTHTNVNKTLTRARARIRLAELREAGAKTAREASS